MPILVTDKIYNHFQFEKEKEFESLINKLSDQIFGSTSIYIDDKKRMKGNEIISIPDGYLIDMTNPVEPKLFIIENEIVSHDPFKHIGIQLLKFATSFEDSKVSLRNYLMDIISNNKSMLKRLNFACSQSDFRNIDNYLDHAVYNNFKAIVLIDEARTELHNVLEKINANISVLEVKAFISNDKQFIYQFNTLYDENDDIETISDNKKSYDYESILKRRKRRAECDTIVVPAKEDGFKRVFLGQNQWWAIRIGAAMKDRIKFIAAYQSAPISAITHIAEIDTIQPYEKTGKYVVKFKDKAEEINKIKIKNPNKSPQGPIYVKFEKLKSAKYIDDLLEY